MHTPYQRTLECHYWLTNNNPDSLNGHFHNSRAWLIVDTTIVCVFVCVAVHEIAINFFKNDLEKYNKFNNLSI